MVFRRRTEKPTEESREPKPVENEKRNTQQLEARIDALDRRLDNIDSMVTAVAERVMSRPMTINVTCPHCGKPIEISLIGNEKPGR